MIPAWAAADSDMDSTIFRNGRRDIPQLDVSGIRNRRHCLCKMTDNRWPLFRRFIAESVHTALSDTPVVMLVGPRQCGKTTLVRELMDTDREYLTLDDDTVLSAARGDPCAFVRGLNRVTIDEVQRAPELLRAIKQLVDNDRQAGRFLLTGSANILALPQISESLAGRMEIVNLMPISRAEVANRRPSFLKMAFEGRVVKPTNCVTGDDLVQAVLIGGYPEMLRRGDPVRRQAWARDYVRAIVQHDVRDITNVDKLYQLPRLLQVLAHHSGQLTNFSQLGGQIGIDDKTVQKYVGVLEQLFLVCRVQPWHRNQLNRVIKTPKLHFVDSGLLAATVGLSAQRIAKNRHEFGALLETFVFSEVTKQIEWSDQNYTLHHYRDKDQDEVDVIVEDERGSLTGIEVKASSTVQPADFKGLRKILGICGGQLKAGVVLYDGTKVVPFGDRLFAAPISCLWN